MKKTAYILPALGLAIATCALAGLSCINDAPTTKEVIVSGSSVSDVRYHVEQLGGVVTGELRNINGVVAEIAPESLRVLKKGGYGFSVFVENTGQTGVLDMQPASNEFPDAS